MKNLTERQRLKLEKDIASAKAQLQREKRTYGFYDDSYGARYFIAEKYFILGDAKKSLRYRTWFYKNFSDDIGSPELHLFWLIAGFQDKKPKVGITHLIDLEEMNVYAIPLMLGLEMNKIDKWESMNYSTLAYAEYLEKNWGKRIPPEIIALLEEITSHPIYVSFKESLIENELALTKESNSGKRGLLLKKEKRIIAEWKKSCENLF